MVNNPDPMTKEEFVELYKLALEEYGEENLPHPDVYPKQFVHIIKMTRYYKRMKDEAASKDNV